LNWPKNAINIITICICWLGYAVDLLWAVLRCRQPIQAATDLLRESDRAV